MFKGRVQLGNPMDSKGGWGNLREDQGNHHPPLENPINKHVGSDLCVGNPNHQVVMINRGDIQLRQAEKQKVIRREDVKSEIREYHLGVGKKHNKKIHLF